MKYISAKDTAKLIRRALKSEHPGTKFSVRTSTYSGGASVSVKWTDGPTQREVDALLAPYAGAGFDGSIDMQYHRRAWLHADGSVTFAETTGTEGSRGSVPSNYGAPQDDTAELVSFGAHYVDTTRTISEHAIDVAEQVAHLHTSPLHATFNGYYEHCFACGTTLDEERVHVRARGIGRDQACSIRCAAKLLVIAGTVRPRQTVSA